MDLVNDLHGTFLIFEVLPVVFPVVFTDLYFNDFLVFGIIFILIIYHIPDGKKAPIAYML